MLHNCSVFSVLFTFFYYSDSRNQGATDSNQTLLSKRASDVSFVSLSKSSPERKFKTTRLLTVKSKSTESSGTGVEEYHRNGRREGLFTDPKNLTSPFSSTRGEWTPSFGSEVGVTFVGGTVVPR